MVYKFLNDYSEGAHPAILNALAEVGKKQQTGYGDDEISKDVQNTFRKLAENPKLDVHFVSGGTQANLLVIAALLKPYESVISAEGGHINTHEAGAVEATGHKIEYVATEDGKLTPEVIDPVLNKFPKYHTVKPRLVYISNSTEVGTVYTKTELEALSAFCKQNDLLLFMDGARLAAALVSGQDAATLKDISACCDVFYFGGTKCGALFGEAIIITNPEFKEDFRYHMKQRGAMLAKGWTISTQFQALFADDLIFDLAKYGNQLAGWLADAFEEKGFTFKYPRQTNQLFPILPTQIMAGLQEKYPFFEWEKPDEEHSVARIVTSWATPMGMVRFFIKDIKAL